MKLHAEIDLEGSREALFAALTDFDHLERRLLNRGVDIVRLREPAGDQSGRAWKAEIELGGQNRAVTGTLAEVAAPERVVMQAGLDTLSGDLVFDLVALSPRRARLRARIEVAATRLRDKILLTSLTLGQGGIEKRFARALRAYAEDAERRAAQGLRGSDG